MSGRMWRCTFASACWHKFVARLPLGAAGLKTISAIIHLLFHNKFERTATKKTADNSPRIPTFLLAAAMSARECLCNDFACIVFWGRAFRCAAPWTTAKRLFAVSAKRVRSRPNYLQKKTCKHCDDKSYLKLIASKVIAVDGINKSHQRARAQKHWFH